MSTIVIDGLNEEDFRRSIESRLREGKASAAIARLRSLLAPYAGPGGILPERFLTVEADDLVVGGWDGLEAAVRRYDEPGRPVTALSVAFGWPGEEVPEPDSEGRLRPYIETGYFSDNAYPFSQSERDDLLEGCSIYGSPWSGDAEATDTALSLEGIDDLHGALAGLEARLLASEEPDEAGIRAGSLGSCLLSALLVRAVTDRVDRDGLPRPLCVMAGSSGVYPYFDAPVAGMPEGAIGKTPNDEAEFSARAPAPRYSSLLMTEVPRARKRAVLVLDESVDETANRLARLRGLNHPNGEDGEILPEPMPLVPALEMPDLSPPTAGVAPLLAQKPAHKPTHKPAGQSLDFRDMLGPRKPAPTPDEAQPGEAVERAEPPLPVARDETPVGPGFTLLESDLQQRLQNLVAANLLPTAATSIPTPPVPGGESALDWPGEPDGAEESCPAPPLNAMRARTMAEAVRPRLRARVHSWLLGKVGGLLARLGL